MTKDITREMQVLENELGPLVVTEFIVGMRFDIHVSEDGVELTQDNEYNQKNHGNLLDLPSLWKTLQNHYRIDEKLFANAPLRNYILKCVFYDQDLMGKQPAMYYGKGFIVTEIIPEQGILVNQSKIEQFCAEMNIPCVKPLFVGPIDLLRNQLQDLRKQSIFSKNKIGSGIIIKNEPVQTWPGTNKIKRFFIQPIYDEVIAPNIENPKDLVYELVRTTLTPKFIEELEDQTKVNLVDHKTKFQRIMVNALNESFPYAVEEYKTRSAFILGNDELEDKFNALVKEEVRNYFKNEVLKLKKYSIQKG